MKLSRKPISMTLTIISAALLSLALVAPLCAQAAPLPLFGPEKFTRETGTPDTASRAFAACNTGATYRLVVENGAAGKDRVSSATIALNGVEVVRPSELNQRVERVEKEVALQGDNILTVRLTSNPGGFLSVSLFCTSGCLDVTITSPPPGSTVNKARTLVQGSLLNASGETGVVLTAAGSAGDSAGLAQVQGNLFVGLVPLQAGENTLTATATDACGYRVSKEVVVHTDQLQDNVRLNAWPDSGVLPTGGACLEITLETSTNLPSAAVRYDWDFDGDGAVEQSGSDQVKVVASYQTPGLYLPIVTVTDALGNSYQDTTAVLVISQVEMDELIQNKWTDMTNALTSGNIDRSLIHFVDGQNSKYKEVFEKLKGQLSAIFKSEEEFSLVYASDNRIEYENIVVEGDKAYSYPVIFVKDVDGLWKINQL